MKAIANGANRYLIAENDRVVGSVCLQGRPYGQELLDKVVAAGVAAMAAVQMDICLELAANKQRRKDEGQNV